MAVDQKGGAELLRRPVHQGFQPSVIGLVIGFDPRQPFGKRNAVAIDRPALGNHAGDDPEAAGDAQRARIGVGGRRLVEQLRIEFVGLAIDVEESARKISAKQGRAMQRRGGEQIVDHHVFRTAQDIEVERGGGEKVRRVVPARMRRGKHQRRGQSLRLDRFASRAARDPCRPEIAASSVQPCCGCVRAAGARALQANMMPGRLIVQSVACGPRPANWCELPPRF